MKNKVIRTIISLLFFSLFIYIEFWLCRNFEDLMLYLLQSLGILSLAISIGVIWKDKNKRLKDDSIKKWSKHQTFSTIIVVFAIPITILLGIYLLKDSRYYLISLLVIAEIFVPITVKFEKKKPSANRLVIISIMCAIAIAGRTAFSFLPQFKPVLALVIISGICLDEEAGFLVGAITGLVSNFYFGQGPWTPWQMFCFGIVGFIAGVFYKFGIVRKSKINLCVFGFLATIIIYGGIMNPASVLMWQPYPSFEIIISSFVMGFPLDVVHGISTVFFLWFTAIPICEKIDRIKTKYEI